MAKFGSFVKMSDDYWTALKDNPSSDRKTTFKNAVESVGGKYCFLDSYMESMTYWLLPKLLPILII